MMSEKIDRLFQNNFFPYACLILAVFAAYANVYNNDFLFDDDLLITLNHFLRSWDTFGTMLMSSTTDGARIVGGFYRPVQNFLYFIIFQIGDQTRFGFHLLNITLHTGNACLAYTLGRKLGFNPTAMLLSILVWALHPLHTEAVTYMSATADPLFVFFCLWGLVVLAPDFSPGKMFIVLPLFLLGLLSKETAVMFPLLVMCCLFLVNDERLNPKIYLRTWPLWAIAALYIAWRVTAPNFDGPQTYVRLFQFPAFENLRLYSEHPMWRIFTCLATLPAYLGLLFWPVGLHLERSFTIYTVAWAPYVVIGFAMTAAAMGQIIWGHGRRGLPLSWGFLWFAAAHAPDTGLLVAMNSLFLEHWMYLPTLGLFMGVGQTIYTFVDQIQYQKFQRIAAGLALITAAAFAARTFDQNNVWHDPISFYTHIFNYGEVSARAHNNLALAYMAKHDPEKAAEEFRKAIAISDTYAETRYNYSLALMSMSDQKSHIGEAIAQLNRSLEIDPNFYRSYDALAKIYAFTGDKQKAAYNQQRTNEILSKRGP